MIKAVIFDLDGTILDSIDTYWYAFNAAVATFKLQPVNKERLLVLMSQGANLAEILCSFYPTLRLETGSNMVERIKAEIRKQYLVHGGDEVRLTSGTQELLRLLRLRGLKIGIVTSRAIPPGRQWEELEKLQVAHFFDAMVTGAEAPRKPAPDTIIECLKRLKLLPEEAIFVGDSQADMMAAKAAGLRTVAVTTGVSHKEVLLEESPDFIFNNLLDFADKVDFVLGRFK